MATNNFERARSLVNAWPEWKRSYVLTKDSARATSVTENKISTVSNSEKKMSNTVNEDLRIPNHGRKD